MARCLSEELTRKELNLQPFVGGIDPSHEKVRWSLRYLSKVKRENSIDRHATELSGFLRAVESVFLRKRPLETADLYEPALDMFGADAHSAFEARDAERQVENHFRSL